MTDHIVKSFDEDLIQLRRMILKMGETAEAQLTHAIEAFAQHDVTLADRVQKMDVDLDLLESQIEEKAIITIAKRQPMAQDLRQIIVTIRIAADLERIGDLAKNTAKRSRAISAALPNRLACGLRRMGGLAQEQLKQVLEAFGRNDLDKAMAIWRGDEEIDSFYNSLFRELLTYMMEDPRTISLCTHLLFCAKNMERIGDHTTNICENIYYSITGRSIPEERPKKDKTSTTDFAV